MSDFLGALSSPIDGSLGGPDSFFSTAKGNVPLILGGIAFDEQGLEVPEHFGDIGGSQSIQEHKFPGGIITHKTYGFFPGILRWKARFHGRFASDDLEGIKRMLADGREVELSYGERAWKGRVVRFTPTARHQHLFEYEIEFWAREDISSGYPKPPLFTGLGSILALHLLALQGLLSGATTPGTYFAGVFSVAGGPIASLLFGVQGAMSGSGGIIGDISTEDKQQIAIDSLASLSALAPMQASTDPTLSAPAWDAAARVEAIQQIMVAAQPPITVLHVVNPNLVVLSVQYYQDPQHWKTIADANGLADPMPIGTFDLLIPPNP